MARNGIGFGDASKADAGEEAVKNLFTPEFRNRLDAIVPFAYLGKEVVSRVVDKFILQLELQLADQNVHIQFDAEARDWLGDRGYDRLYGARPMARLIQDKVKQPLAEELLFGKLAHGGEVRHGEGRRGRHQGPSPSCSPPRRPGWIARRASPRARAPETARAAPSPKPRAIMTDRPDL
jgi:ATP-dependent Clp protease ATP-binding subunit ClpA